MNEVCDIESWAKDDKYMKIVKEEENTDKFGGNGNYAMSDNFKFCIVAQQEAGAIDEMREKWPGSD